ncbi:hypothetical protein L198_07292 [Cryptococcus wingfieldii CBS 7118]|uniref:Uncharacterized protein n=1 Tax=Cryptococcus wingfieldii CBS 7118 TaxID=1295528 RepID=A0A1E3IDC3_9TREE|nr:hypothetical protein L198_07292 [Cryptococcus wingfieldii CBS 7118]ODN86597.1 hypothetical protein L198_07292 [Cryptococcus wingfieldii CBS 7118]
MTILWASHHHQLPAKPSGVSKYLTVPSSPAEKQQPSLSQSSPKADEISTSTCISRSSSSDSLSSTASTTSLAYQLPPFPMTFPGFDVVDLFKLVQRGIFARKGGLGDRSQEVKEGEEIEMMDTGKSG